MSVTERVAYLKGLLEGMELDTDKKEGKVWKAVLAVLEELAECVCELEDDNARFSDVLSEFDEELAAFEEEMSGEHEDFLDEEEDSLYQVICPTCGEVIFMDDSLLSEGSTICPA